MMAMLLAIGSAFWVGVLTSISPCPLATNIAAISFVSKKIESRKIVLLTGLLYTLGRMVAYIGLSVLIIASIYSIPGLSLFLQNQIHKILGPILIVVGMFLLELVSIPLPSLGNSSKVQSVLKSMGIWGALPLGILFALSFCPVSAALYFGSLIPLATKYSSTLLLPSAYGVGTGFPVFIFALLIAFGASKVAKIFDKIGKFEKWFRVATGVVFLMVGIYFCLTYIFEVL